VEYSTDDGIPYYYNLNTQDTQWEMPAEFANLPPQIAAPLVAAAAASSYSHQSTASALAASSPSASSSYSYRQPAAASSYGSSQHQGGAAAPMNPLSANSFDMRHDMYEDKNNRPSDAPLPIAFSTNSSQSMLNSCLLTLSFSTEPGSLCSQMNLRSSMKRVAPIYSLLWHMAAALAMGAWPLRLLRQEWPPPSHGAPAPLRPILLSRPARHLPHLTSLHEKGFQMRAPLNPPHCANRVEVNSHSLFSRHLVFL
jgi:hypothetical protein